MIETDLDHESNVQTIHDRSELHFVEYICISKN